MYIHLDTCRRGHDTIQEHIITGTGSKGGHSISELQRQCIIQSISMLTSKLLLLQPHCAKFCSWKQDTDPGQPTLLHRRKLWPWTCSGFLRPTASGVSNPGTLAEISWCPGQTQQHSEWHSQAIFQLEQERSGLHSMNVAQISTRGKFEQRLQCRPLNEAIRANKLWLDAGPGTVGAPGEMCRVSPTVEGRPVLQRPQVRAVTGEVL